MTDTTYEFVAKDDDVLDRVFDPIAIDERDMTPARRALLLKEPIGRPAGSTGRGRCWGMW